MEHIKEDLVFQKRLQGLAVELNQPYDEVVKKSQKYLKEMFTEHQPVMTTLASQSWQYLLSRAYEKSIDVNPQEIKSLSKIMRKHSVAFVMTHKTYIDMVVLATVLFHHGLPMPHIFAGINMSFMGVAQIGRRTGVIFIRRDIRDNKIYKVTLRHFISSLVKNRASFMWAIEGTRSRTGKLVWPKMGILKYIVEAERQSGKEVKYVPVSVVYDLIPDVQDMTAESRGKGKNPETLTWFVNYLRKMGAGNGRISLRFGAPVDMRKSGDAEIPDDHTDPTASYTLPRFAFELIHKINQITPVTTASLICTTLLSKFSEKKSALETDVIELMQLIERHKHDTLVDRGKSIGDSTQKALILLKKAHIIQQLGDGLNAKYAIITRNFLPAVYYANMAVHHLYHRAFIEVALVRVAQIPATERLIQFWREIMSLRNLFKFEFFYSNKPQFSDEIEHDLDFINPQWQQILNDPEGDVIQMLKDQRILVSHAVLSTYVEAYSVVCRALCALEPSKSYNEKNILHECLFLGDEMHWQGHIHRIESVSKPLLLNGLRYAKNQDLIPTTRKRKSEALNTFGCELSEVSEALSTVQKILMDKKDQRTPILPIEMSMVPGSQTASTTAPVIDGESGSHIGAFFDLDRTLIQGFSAKEFFQSRLLSGKMSPNEIVAQFNGVLVYALGNRNFAGLAAIGAKGIKGIKEQVFIEVGEEVYMKHLAQTIYPESRALVAAHLAKGHTVAIISAATPYQVNPIARDLNIKHVMCSRMEVKNGKFTGKIIEPACWGEGKAHAAMELVKKYNLELSKSYFYTDSIEDLPLLEIVGNPRPLNPDRELSTVAFQNNWPVASFRNEPLPGLSSLIRAGLAFGSLIPAALSGVISGVLSLSWEEGVNSMVGKVGDLGTLVAGIKLAVKGQENLWKERPAVFILNHQSNADVFIASKLLKKDVVAIAKKELKYSPVGPIFMAAGVIFIDRSDKEKAIEAMKPAVDALKGGKSLAIFPEGTRSYDYRLGRFKKGAFHLAMQAGVPIVPIVVKNAHDVMPRGKMYIQPTVVEVVILPPVSTQDWNKENMNEKIEEIRKLYLKELGQIELPVGSV